MSDVDVAAPSGEALRLEQRADLRSFLSLSLKNGLLNIVTLTLYRFWGKTEVRRRVWSSTWLNGEPFEYTGRGIELFLGFLIALVVLGGPFLVVVFGAQFMGPAGALLILPLYLGMIFLIGVGMFTAFRYMASRTAWRGVRFHLRGKATNYALHFFGYLLVTVVTFGWFWPAAQRRLAGELWGGLSFGDRPFVFDIEAARREEVYLAYMIGAFGTGALYILWLIVFGLTIAAIGVDRLQASPGLQVAITYAMLIPLGLAALALFAPYNAARLRSVAAGVRFDDVKVKLKLTWTEMFWLEFSNIALVIVTIGFLMPFVQARTARFLLSRVQFEGVADLASVRQTVAGPRTGEGLADAFGLASI